MRLIAQLALVSAIASAPAASALDWPQFNLDPQHSGNNTQEHTITPGNVATLHLAYPAVSLPAVADAPPVLLEGVSTPDGVKDLLFLTTKSGILLAIDAANGSTVWSKQPATGPNYTTSSPAIDPNRLYVYSYGLEGRVHKYEVGDGTEITTGGWPELTTRKPDVEKVSPALAIVPTAGAHYLVVGNGGYPGDAGDYQGHVTVIDLATGGQNVFNANCSDQTCHFYENGSGGCGSPQPDCTHVQSAIWARVGVVYDSALDLIFMATGNGDFDATSGGNDWGDSVFALNPDGTGNGSGWPVDSYTPTEYQSLQDTDLDLGSTAPAILPVPAGSTVAHLGLQSGKDSKLRLLDLADLSGQGGPGHTGGELQKINLPQGGVVLTAPAVWVNPVDGATWVFVANGSGISGFKLGLNGSNVPQLATTAPGVWTKTPGGTSPVIADDMVFYSGYDGQVHALDPTTGTQLWADSTPNGLHWESPIVVNGRVYLTDDSGHLLVYEPTMYALTVTRSGSGTGSVSSDPAGISCGATCSAPFASGLTVTLSATPAGSSLFTGWSGEGCSGTGDCQVVMSKARNVTATFTLKTVDLSVGNSGSGDGTVVSSPAGIDCGAACDAGFPYGTTVLLAAAADPGSVFAGWSGEGCGGIGACQVTMTQARAVTATFNALQASGFYPVTPCRVVDTRNLIDTAPVKRGNFTDGETRAYTLSDSTDCPDLPSDATAWSLNIQLRPVSQPAFLTAFPDGVGRPAVSTLVGFPVRWRANDAIVAADSSGTFDVYCQYAARVVIDVNGYFK
jgi:outer membrane protein assembly factor BamB